MISTTDYAHRKEIKMAALYVLLVIEHELLTSYRMTEQSLKGGGEF